MSRVPQLDEMPPAEWTDRKSTSYLPDATLEEAWLQGAWAFTFGFEDDQNPYPDGNDCRESWFSGWSDAASDDGG